MRWPWQEPDSAERVSEAARAMINRAWRCGERADRWRELWRDWERAASRPGIPDALRDDLAERARSAKMSTDAWTFLANDLREEASRLAR